MFQSKKPLMEKKRRKRINDSLNDLKNILLEIMKKDPTQTAKLEKADILEFTAQYLKELQWSQLTIASVASPTPTHHFWAGWRECSEEINKYFQIVKSDQDLRINLLNHLESIRLRCFHIRGPVPMPLVPVRPTGPAMANQHMYRTVKNCLNSQVKDLQRLKTESTKQPNSDEQDKHGPWRPW